MYARELSDKEDETNMKATELMHELEVLIAKHGDQDVGLVRLTWTHRELLPITAVKPAYTRHYRVLSAAEYHSVADEPDAFILSVEY